MLCGHEQAWMNLGVMRSWFRYRYFLIVSAFSTLRNLDIEASGSRLMSSSPAKTGLLRLHKEHLICSY